MIGYGRSSHDRQRRSSRKGDTPRAPSVAILRGLPASEICTDGQRARNIIPLPPRLLAPPYFHPSQFIKSPQTTALSPLFLLRPVIRILHVCSSAPCVFHRCFHEAHHPTEFAVVADHGAAPLAAMRPMLPDGQSRGRPHDDRPVVRLPLTLPRLSPAAVPAGLHPLTPFIRLSKGCSS